MSALRACAHLFPYGFLYRPQPFKPKPPLTGTYVKCWCQLSGSLSLHRIILAHHQSTPDYLNNCSTYQPHNHPHNYSIHFQEMYWSIFIVAASNPIKFAAIISITGYIINWSRLFCAVVGSIHFSLIMQPLQNPVCVCIFDSDNRRGK